MPQIEELPDDFDDKVNLEDGPKMSGPSLADMYDKHLHDLPGTGSNKTFEEIMADMSKTPLFMNNLEVAGTEEGENEILEALKALQHEGTRNEVAQNFKEQGNEQVQAKHWKDAKEFYNKGIAVLTTKDLGKWELPEDEVADAKERRLLEEQIHVNRALCNLELKNYRSTTLDCAAALKLNPSNIKAHYRSAMALLALDKVHEALDVCARGQKVDPDNTSLSKLLAQIQSRAKIIEDRDRRRIAEVKRKQEEQQTLTAALKARHIRTRGSPRPPDLEDAVIRLSPDPRSTDSTLEFPVMFLYPMHNQSDFVKTFAENEALLDHLSYIFPLPWDSKAEYQLAQTECYMDTISGGMIKVGKKLSLLEMLSNGKTEVVDGLVRIFVVPKQLASNWIDEVQRKRTT